MGVKKICTLVVPDRQYSPHSWDKIHWCVKTFQVEHLYWRAVDMLLVDEDRECSCDSDELRDKQQICFGTLRSLHLYCTGNKNTIQQWFSSRNGLSRLQKLSTLEIRIVEAPAMSGDKIQDLQDRLEKRLEDWRLSPRSDDNVVERVYTVERYQWNDEIGSRSRDAHDGTEFHIPELSRFLQQYRDNFGQHDQVPRTKVAVIDDGMMMVVNASRHSLQAQASSQVVKGKGFVYKDGSLSPWFSPGSDGHGTHMACLISRLDPHCDLHIAQVRGPNEPLYLSAVVMAIKWAIEQQVDIISMSLALRKTTPILESKLERAIQEAEQNHIVDEKYSQVMRFLPNLLVRSYRSRQQAASVNICRTVSEAGTTTVSQVVTSPWATSIF
ncbi:hypothetical protein DOTSEDRAFT_73732 [Dothistroma septosporum NZE10]|uniref:Peptidase S8/S53 domain-containing protein n=1 Tax=Dothistroma septosporum (strain NZE10 / CBS 128990) TaxID=675120 RepID=N1PGA7_DOTSN|nr:hypothetical protein DOTSEDRAFT_73732 [Dothistroma septosporum NZE10]